jgi:hypothetical protein
VALVEQLQQLAATLGGRLEPPTIIVDVRLDSKLVDWDVAKHAEILLQLMQVSPPDFLG